VSDVKITVSEHGSIKVEGEPPLFDFEGNRIGTREGKAFFLCRCGTSENKPFCDGAHKTCGFDGQLATRD